MQPIQEDSIDSANIPGTQLLRKKRKSPARSFLVKQNAEKRGSPKNWYRIAGYSLFIFAF